MNFDFIITIELFNRCAMNYMKYLVVFLYIDQRMNFTGCYIQTVTRNSRYMYLNGNPIFFRKIGGT